MRPSEFKARKATIGGSELSASMAAVLGNLLLKHGIDNRKADEIALEAMAEMRREYGGSQLYFNREESLQKAAVHEEMFDRFDSNEMSVADLSLEYGFSLAWTYKIIKNIRRQRKEERAAQTTDAQKRKQERWKREN